jgi:hypothetical protein
MTLHYQSHGFDSTQQSTDRRIITETDILNDLFFARSQMGMSLAFHIIFAVIGMAMPLLMAVSEGLEIPIGLLAGLHDAYIMVASGISGTLF